jgi:hypothetical protein
MGQLYQVCRKRIVKSCRKKKALFTLLLNYLFTTIILTIVIIIPIVLPIFFLLINK